MAMHSRLERIRNHQVWSEIDESLKILARVSTLTDVDPSHLSEFDRFNKCVDFISTRLKQTDSSLVVPNLCDNLANQLFAARTGLQAYEVDRGFQHVEQAGSELDAALITASQLALVATANDIEHLNKTSSKYFSLIQRAHQQSREEVEGLRKMASEIDGHFRKLASDFEATRSVAHSLLRDHEKSFAEAQMRRSEESDESRRALQNRLDQVIAEHQSQFSTSQETRNAAFSAAQNNRAEQFSSLVADYTRDLQNQSRTYKDIADTLALEQSKITEQVQARFEEQARTILSTIEGHREQVEKLVGVIGDLGVTSGHKKAADRAQYSMWVWQVLTLCAFGVFIWFGHTAFLLTLSGSFSWPMFTGRALLTAAVASVAVYTGKQASNFFEVEKKHRTLALELEALRPFISGLPIEQQNAFRIDIGKKAFGREEASHDLNAGGVPANLVSLGEAGRFIEKIIQLFIRR